MKPNYIGAEALRLGLEPVFTVEQLNQVERRKHERRAERKSEVRGYLWDLRTMLQRAYHDLRGTNNSQMINMLLDLEIIGSKRLEEIKRK